MTLDGDGDVVQREIDELSSAELRRQGPAGLWKRLEHFGIFAIAWAFQGRNVWSGAGALLIINGFDAWAPRSPGYDFARSLLTVVAFLWVAVLAAYRLSKRAEAEHSADKDLIRKDLALASWKRDNAYALLTPVTEQHRDVQQENLKLQHQLTQARAANAQLMVEATALTETVKKLSRGPELIIEFDRTDPRCTIHGGTVAVRVTNTGTARARDLALVLEGLSANQETRVAAHLGARFFVAESQMSIDLFSISPGQPVYVAVLYQTDHATYGSTQQLLLNRRMAEPLHADWLELILRLECDIPVPLYRMRFEKQGSTRLQVMSVMPVE